MPPVATPVAFDQGDHDEGAVERARKGPRVHPMLHRPAFSRPSPGPALRSVVGRRPDCGIEPAVRLAGGGSPAGEPGSASRTSPNGRAPARPRHRPAGIGLRIERRRPRRLLGARLVTGDHASCRRGADRRRRAQVCKRRSTETVHPAARLDRSALEPGRDGPCRHGPRAEQSSRAGPDTAPGARGRPRGRARSRPSGERASVLRPPRSPAAPCDAHRLPERRPPPRGSFDPARRGRMARSRLPGHGGSRRHPVGGRGSRGPFLSDPARADP